MKIKSWEGKFSMHILISISVFILLILLVSVWVFMRDDNSLKSGETIVTIGRGEYIVEVASSPALKAQGLSGRESLEEGAGMLFPFNPPSKTGFWMKGMEFPIDIIWIADGKVIGFEENAPVPSGFNFPVHKPLAPVDLVLEINSGEVAKQGIKVGDKIEIK